MGRLLGYMGRLLPMQVKECKLGKSLGRTATAAAWMILLLLSSSSFSISMLNFVIEGQNKGTMSGTS